MKYKFILCNAFWVLIVRETLVWYFQDHNILKGLGIRQKNHSKQLLGMTSKVNHQFSKVYGRHWISQRVRIVASITKNPKNISFLHLHLSHVMCHLSPVTCHLSPHRHSMQLQLLWDSMNIRSWGWGILVFDLSKQTWLLFLAKNTQKKLFLFGRI